MGTSNMLIPLVLSFILPIVLRRVYQDYQAFIKLGPGGTPQTVAGYLRISLLRLFALKNPCTPAPIPADVTPRNGYIGAKLAFHQKPLIPQRRDCRPIVAGIAPHRQTNQKSCPTTYAQLALAIRNLASNHPTLLKPGTSCFEKHTEGIFSLKPINGTCKGEVCHAHPSDGSMHLSLHPVDARTVIEKGWGERHPLAKGGWFKRFVPPEFTMIYAPRTEEELSVVIEIIKAAAWWVGGESLDGIRIDGHLAGSVSEKGLLDQSCEWGLPNVIRPS